MTIAYECLGRDEYQQEELADDPYKRGNYYNSGSVFRDIWTWNHGFRYTPEQLGIVAPFPDTYTDSSGITYRKIEVKEIDNAPFTQKAREGVTLDWPNTRGETFTPQVEEKEQVPDNTGYTMSSTWSELKKKGLLK